MSKASRAASNALLSQTSLKYGDFNVDKTWKYINNPLAGAGGKGVLAFNPNDINQKFLLDDGNSSDAQQLSEYLGASEGNLADYSRLGDYFKDPSVQGSRKAYEGLFAGESITDISEKKRKQAIVDQINSGQISRDQGNQMANSIPSTAPTVYEQAYNQQPASSQPPKSQNSNINPNQTAGSTQQPTQQQVQPEVGGAPALMLTQNLRTGSKGNEVSQLQSLLGINADGIFGNQTSAAVKAFQAAHGLVTDGIVGAKTLAALNQSKVGPPAVSNVAAGAGQNQGAGKVAGASTGPSLPSTGNPEVDSLIEALNNQSPQKSFSDVYKETYKSLGLDTMKQSYTDQTKEFTALQDKKNDEKQVINNNPWFTEGVRQQKLKQLDAKYEGKETILTNKLKLLESNISNGRADAQFVSGQIMDQLQQSSKLQQDVILKAIDIAEKQAEAESGKSAPASVQEYKYAVSQGFKGTFSDYQNEDANRKIKINAAANAAGLTPALMNTALKLSDDYEARSKDYYQQREAFNRIMSSASDPSAAGDLALIFNYMKVLDPGSTVREGEFANAQNAGSAWNIIGAKYNKVLNGERLTVPQRTDFVDRATKLFDGAKAQQDSVANEFTQRATKYGVPGDLVVRETSATGNTQKQSKASKFDYLQNSITVQGKNAYLPIKLWDTLSASDKHELIIEAKNDGYKLLVN